MLPSMTMVLYDERAKSDAIERIEKLNFDQYKWQIEISVWEDTRTLAQNRLYQKWLNILTKETGNDRDAIHEYFKDKFLEKKYKEFNGKLIEIRKSTANLGIKVMSHYLTQIESFAASELGITLPTPEDSQSWLIRT